MTGSKENRDKLARQQDVLWPEFRWETEPGTPSSRCYQMFAPDISRLGYTDRGRIYSIICPQQGRCLKKFGCLNVEVSVTAVSGWVDETTKAIAGDMKVEGKIWFSASPGQSTEFDIIRAAFESQGHKFPLRKDDAIIVKTHKRGAPEQPVFGLFKDETTDLPIPDFARHADEACSVGHLDVENGPIVSTDGGLVDEFNARVMELFNTGTGNLLKQGNVLSWNVWFDAPQRVNQKEWFDHADKWRKSIDANHGSPDGPGTNPRFFDGSADSRRGGATDHGP